MTFIRGALFTAIALLGGGAFSSVSAPVLTSDPVDLEAFSLYNSIEWIDGERPDSVMFQHGLLGLQALQAAGRLSEKSLMTLIDFSKPSTEKRLWIIDLEDHKVLYHTLVSHGRNSGELYATRFSNKPNSNQSSLGLYVTGKIYQGKNGTSMKLHGVEPGINDMAENRAIVMHGAAYASDAFATQTGRLGRSFGCPAIPMDVHKEIINLLANGTCLFIYHPDRQKTFVPASEQRSTSVSL